MNKSRKQLIKAVVLTVGVADCVGIYLVNHRLDTSVPDEVRYDQAAYALPTSADVFQAQPAMFADARPAAAAPAPGTAAVPAAPKLAAAPAAAAAKPAGAALRLAAAPVPAAADIGNALTAPRLAARAAAPQRAKVDQPLTGPRTAGATITSQAATTSLAPGAAVPARTALHKAPARRASSLAGLVPKARAASEFSSAFAGFDAPLAVNVPLENLVSPADASSRGASDFADASPASPVLETIVPEAAPAPEPLNASAETSQAAL